MAENGYVLLESRGLVTVGGADRHVTVWSLATGERLHRFFCSDQVDDWQLNPVHQVRGLAFEPVADRLFASLVNTVIVTWDIGNGWRETRRDRAATERLTDSKVMRSRPRRRSRSSRSIALTASRLPEEMRPSSSMAR